MFKLYTVLLWIQLAATAARPRPHNTTAAVQAAVQPILDDMAVKWNISFSLGFTDSEGSTGVSAGWDSIWDHEIAHHFHTKTKLKSTTLIPLGSVTKPWTALRIMQHVERGRIALEDPAFKHIDPVLHRLWNSSLGKLWGTASSNVTIRHLLGMTSGFADYTDEQLEKATLRYSGDDVAPFVYLLSASHSGYVCPTGSCAAYSGANFVLLGLVLVQLDGGWSWQDLDQRSVIPAELWQTGRYSHTSFARLGRCSQYPGVAHQYATSPLDTQSDANVTFLDLEEVSCLNGWTMGNIMTTPTDLATFFYDMVTLSPSGQGFVNATTLDMMTQYHSLSDTWCVGPSGPGSCSYGLGLFKDQLGQDYFYLQNSSENIEKVRLTGHPGADWGSGVSPCGYNTEYKFGVCIAYTSVTGMNCSIDFTHNNYAIYETTCLAYDAVLSVMGGPRLDCYIPQPADPGERLTCDWAHLEFPYANQTRPHMLTRHRQPSVAGLRFH